MSIQKRPNGKWQARYRDPSGRHRAGSFRTKVEASAWLAERQKEVHRGGWVDPSAGKVTVAFVYADWIEAKANITERTRFGYRELWKACIEPTWGTRRLDSIQPADVTRWLAGMSREGLSPSRIRKAYTVLNQVLAWAVADGRIPSNPVARARELSKAPILPRMPAKQGNRYLTAAEVRRLATAATTVRAAAKAKQRKSPPDPVTADYEAMLLTMAFTGLRFGEVTALRGKDLDLLGSRVLVRRAFTDVGGELQEVAPKSGKSREVYLDKALGERLAPLLTAAGAEGLLFTAPEGGPVRYSNWRKSIFDKATAAAGLEGVSPHALRHTFAALSVRAGVNVKALQVAMGHADIRMTLDTYGGLFDADTDAFGALFSKAIAEPDVREMCADDSGAVAVIARRGESNPL